MFNPQFTKGFNASTTNKLESANFLTPIEKLTEHNLFLRLTIGIENSPVSQAIIDEQLNELPEAVYNYWHNGDHGLRHSQKVLQRCKELLEVCPNMLRLCHHQDVEFKVASALINWASILHDIARFTSNCAGFDHQIVGAELADNCFRTEIDEEISALLHGMIRHHDYVCEFVDGRMLPLEFLDNPLSEIFRLADKTSLSPKDEIARYYQTGKRFDNPFFNAEMTKQQRLDFNDEPENWDYVKYFLLFFATQPSDWFFGETRDIYRSWSEKTAGGKIEAMSKVIELAHREKLSHQQFSQLFDVFDQFFRKFNLPNYVG